MHPAALDNIREVAQNYNEAKTQLLYKKLVEIARQQCEDRLEKIGRKGIKGVVHGRVKKYASLTNKLTQIQKDEKKSPDFGASVSSIYEHPDMGDLAGVRIGLYFPDDIAKVEKEIKEHFDVKHTFGTVRGGRDVTTDRNEDIEKHGNGPWSSDGQDGAADHWEHCGYKSWQVVVEWKGSLLEELCKKVAVTDLPLQPPRIEIQIGTVVTQAWAEVQHNIIYKNPHNLRITPTMKRIVDAVNGLAITTDIMLKELDQSLEQARKDLEMKREGEKNWSAP